MSIPILNELQSELERLYTAGSQLAKDDPRLRKYIQPLQALGQRAPVFSSLASSLEELAGGEENSSPEKLLEAGSLLYAVQYTQGETSMEGNWEELSEDVPFLEQRCIPYSQLSRTVALLCSENRAPSSELAALTESGDFRDPRLYPYFAAAAGSAADSSDLFIEKQIIPMTGSDMIPYLLACLNMEGTKADAVRFSLLCSLMPDSLDITLKALEGEPGGPVYLSAVENLRYFPHQEQTLTELAQMRRKAVREEAFSSLAFMNTPAGNELIRSRLVSGNADDLTDALALSSDIQTVQLMHVQFEQCLADIKNSSKKLKSLYPALVQRDEDKGFELLFRLFTVYEKDQEVSLLLNFGEMLYYIRKYSDRRKISGLLYRLGSAGAGYAAHKVYAAPFLLSPQDVYSECRSLISSGDLSVKLSLMAAYGLSGAVRDTAGDSERRWDERWAQLFIKKKDMVTAYLFVFDRDTGGWSDIMDWAVSLFNKNSSSYYYSSLNFRILGDAFRLNHPKAQKYYKKYIKAGADKTALDKFLNIDIN